VFLYQRFSFIKVDNCTLELNQHRLLDSMAETGERQQRIGGASEN